MNKYDELINVARLLKTVSVTGEYWTIMQACLNSVLQVAEAIKAEEKENSNEKRS